ncbi:MAG: M1 family metallopeptidase [Saprospiraceae bacterium]|nr:M1 family metallopeptidase [Saprospiraceae bacterium]
MTIMVVNTCVFTQCNTSYNQSQSLKIANYDIEVHLDHKGKSASCIQKLNWKNTSPDTLRELRFYMYMNAFKDLKSTYLKNTRKMFGQDLKNRTKKEWGHIEVTQAVDRNGNDLVQNQEYIQPNDGNALDETVLSIPLEMPLLPGEVIELDMNFDVKLPRTIVRSGYGPRDFFLFVHWFPQVCVYELKVDGNWGWNSHQFMPGTEFFSDFGDYNVEIYASDHLVIGGSGCKTFSGKVLGTIGEQLVRFQAYDLIDFGWVAYPEYETYTSTYGDTDIEILMVPEHYAFADRYLKAIEQSLEYLEKHVGKYPYPKITVVDPPTHTLNSGFMEYPMMITGATAYGIPRSVRSVESLVIHEFTHMYFMASLASNEKEEAWLDEGFVTYFEDRILDHYYGNQSSLFDVLGARSGNAQQSRNEYVSMENPNLGKIARPGWEFDGGFKSLIYAKTATAFKTMERIIGSDIMDEIIKTYFERHKFTHPKEADLRKIIKEVLEKNTSNFDSDKYLNQVLHDTSSINFKMVDINNSTKTIEAIREGNFEIGTEVLIMFKDGSSKTVNWKGSEKHFKHTFSSSKEVISAHIDPEQKIYLDLNLNNNSITLDPNKKPLYKYAAKLGHWLQAVSQWTSFMM